MSINGLPDITNRDVKSLHRAIKEGALEGKVPSEGREVEIAPGYSMSIIGEVTAADETVLSLNKPKNDFPFLAIRDDVSGKIKKLSVADAMRENFGCYIDGYRKTRFAPNDYTLAPKNGDRSNFMLNNLEFVERNSQILTLARKAMVDALHHDTSVYFEGSSDKSSQEIHTHDTSVSQASDN